MVSDDLYSAWMTRDATESERLNLQHDLITEALGYIIHPTVETAIHPHARVADIATGTAVVLTDLAKVLPPTCQLDGFDLSGSQFPRPDQLPTNITLQLADAKESMPGEYHGKYDIVYLRYLTVAMNRDDWETVSRNMFQLLKPGGWLQWVEFDIDQASTLLRGDPKIPISDASQVGSEAVRLGMREWNFAGDHLTEILRQVGFSNVLRDVTSSDRIPEMRKGWWIIGPRPYTLFWQKVEKEKADRGEPTEDIAKRIAQIGEDVASGGIYFRFDLYTFAGQKPK